MEITNLCKGECLIQNSLLTYKSINCPNIIPCIPNLCKNFNLCKQQLPKEMSMCTWCSILLGKVKEYPNSECPICYDITLCFEQPRCEHFLCRKCYHNIYFGIPLSKLFIEQNIGTEPLHPYSAYENNIDGDDYDKNEYPLMTEYHTIWNEWYDKKEIWINRIMAQKCCLCRK